MNVTILCLDCVDELEDGMLIILAVVGSLLSCMVTLVSGGNVSVLIASAVVLYV